MHCYRGSLMDAYWRYKAAIIKEAAASCLDGRQCAPSAIAEVRLQDVCEELSRKEKS
jgi:hypothetical protein